MAFIKCKACNKETSQIWDNCPHCGEPLAAKSFKKSGGYLWPLSLMLIGLLAVAVFVGNNKEKASVYPVEKIKPDRQMKMQITKDSAKVRKRERKKKSITGPTLFVQSKSANMHENPSTKSRVIMVLGKGYKLTELERKYSWVKVHVETTGGKFGWVHSSLVGPEFIGGSTYAPKSAAFGRFLREFDDLNTQLRISTGNVFFTEAEDLGEGIIQVTATDRWLNRPKTDREKILKTIFQLWDSADSTGLPITVYIADQNGIRRMEEIRENSLEQSSNHENEINPNNLSP